MSFLKIVAHEWSELYSHQYACQCFQSLIAVCPHALNMVTSVGISGSRLRWRSLLHGAMPQRTCDICGRTDIGDGKCRPFLGRDLTACPRARGLGRGDVMKLLLEGREVTGVSASGRLWQEAQAILARRVSSDPCAAAEARSDEPEAEPPNQQAARVCQGSAQSPRSHVAWNQCPDRRSTSPAPSQFPRLPVARSRAEEKAPRART